MSVKKERRLELLYKYGGSWIVAFLVTIVCVFFTKTFFAIILYSPDDWMFEAFLSGKFTGEPSPYLYFQKYPFSYIIANLYKISNLIPWYSVMLFGGVVLSFTLIVERIINLRDMKMWIRICLCALLFGIMFINQFVFIEWTRTAGCLFGAALFRLMTIDIDKTKWGRCIDLLVIFILLLWCYGLRHTIFLMGSPFIFLAVFVLGIKYWKEKSIYEIKTIIVFIIIIVFGVCGTEFIHDKAYDSASWTSYEEYTNNRSVLMDLYGFPNYEEHEEVYEELSISKSAYTLMNVRCYIIPEDEFSENNIARLAKIAKSDNNESLPDKMIATYNLASKSVKTTTLLAARIFTIFIVLLIIGLVKKWYVVIWAFGGLGIASVLLWHGRFPMYVEISLFLIVVLGELAFAINNGCIGKTLLVNRKRTILKTAFILVTITCFIISNINLYEMNIQKSEEVTTKNILIEYVKKHPDKIYIRDFCYSQLPEGLLDPDTFWSDNYISAGGWAQKTPSYGLYEDRIGIRSISNYIDNTGEIYYLVSKSVAKKRYKTIKQYYNEKRDDIVIKKVDKINGVHDDIIVFRIGIKKNK